MWWIAYNRIPGTDSQLMPTMNNILLTQQPDKSAKATNYFRTIRRRVLSLASLELAVITLLAILYLSLFPLKNVNEITNLHIHLFDVNVRLDGLEHERLSGVLLPIEIGLRRYGHIPTWNPYMGIGEPTINNPFNYLFNLPASVPVILFGGVSGTKLAIILALLFAGYNMWVLMRIIGIGAVGRVTVGALYMMSGGIAGKFHAGHFQLGLSLTWMPLVFAGLWWTLRSTDHRAPVLMAVAFALLFFAGNIYYTLHTLVCAAVMVAFHMFDGHQMRLRLRRVMAGGLFAFGLAALQFIPVWSIQGYIGGHPGDPTLESRYDLGQALTNFTFPWPNWIILEDRYYKMITGVDYAYIGPAAFLFIAAGAAWLFTRHSPYRISNRMIAWIALVLAVGMTTWGAGQTPMVQYLYANIPRLAEFRFVGRAHAVAALWLLVLAGFSVDMLWNAVCIHGQRRRSIRAMLTGGLVWLLFLAYSFQSDSGRAAFVFYNYPIKGALDNHRFLTFNAAAQGFFVLTFIALVVDTALWVVGWLLFGKPRISREILGKRMLQLLAWGVIFLALADVMLVNSRLLVFNRRIADFSALYPYIREHETGAPFPAINEPHSPFAFAAYEMEIRNWGLDEGWNPMTPPSIIPFDEGTFSDIPRWALVWNEEGSRLSAQQYVESFGHEERLCTSTEIEAYLSERCNLDTPGAAILYEQSDVLPYAFVVAADRVLTAPETIGQATVNEAEVVSHRQDTIIIRASTPTNESAHYLVVQETHFPGWQVLEDEVPVETVSIGPFIGIEMQSGEHVYTLRFVPPGLATGVVVFLATLVGIILYVRRGPSKEVYLGTVY